MGSATVEPCLHERLAEAARSASCELLHVEYRAGVLRLILDRPEGVNLEHCAQVSRQASAVLDSEDFGDRKYVLEVSSPGLDRELYSSADYERFVGHAVRVTFADAASGKRRTISGPLLAFDPDQGGRVTVEAEDRRQTEVVPLQDIHKARLEIEL